VHIIDSHYLFAERMDWTVLFWIGIAGLGLGSSAGHSRDRSDAKGEIRDRGSKPFIYIMTFAACACALAAPKFYPQAHIDLPPAPVFYTAIAMLWGGDLLYVWSVATLGAFFRTSVTLIDGQRLVTKGPYRILRHPAYTGGVLIFTGFGLAMGNWLSVAGSALCMTLGYLWRIHVEEKALRERFGAEFEAHRKRTWMLIPFAW